MRLLLSSHRKDLLLGDFHVVDLARVLLEIDEGKLRALRAKARQAGFSNLNMPREYGGMDLPVVSQVALEEEAGKVTNGLGYMVADRGPRELLDLASPEQIERYVMPVVRGETREAWAITEPGQART